MTSNFDDEANTELLCYLVIAQLVARSCTGEWLRTDHLVESTRIWLAGSKRTIDPVDRVRVAQLSQQIAAELPDCPEVRDSRVLVRMFTSRWSLDSQSALVRTIYGICVTRLNCR